MALWLPRYRDGSAAVEEDEQRELSPGSRQRLQVRTELPASHTAAAHGGAIPRPSRGALAPPAPPPRPALACRGEAAAKAGGSAPWGGAGGSAWGRSDPVEGGGWRPALPAGNSFTSGKWRGESRSGAMPSSVSERRVCGLCAFLQAGLHKFTAVSSTRSCVISLHHT